MNRIWTDIFSRLAHAGVRISLLIAVALGLTGIVAERVHADGGIDLGTAGNFAVLGGQSVTNTGPSVVTGHLGVAPGSAITGFPPGIVNGEIHAADAVAIQAQSDALIAYVALASQPCGTDLTGQDLGGMTLTAGVYCFSSSAQLTGALTLDAQGDPNSVWIFQIGSGLNSASGASVQVINGGNACNAYWQVGSSATIGTGNAFAGNILALASISLGTGTDLAGRALASVGSVTMSNNDVSFSSCAAPTAVTLTEVQANDSLQWLPGGLAALGLAVLAIVLVGVTLQRDRHGRDRTKA